MSMTTKANPYHVYVGTYGEELDASIQILSLDTEARTLKLKATAKGIKNPSYLTIDKQQQLLYAVSEVDQGEVVSYLIREDNAYLTEQSYQSTYGNGPCYVTLDETESYLLTVNYGEGTTTVHQLQEDGAIGPLTDQQEYGAGSHPHTIVHLPYTHKYVVTDLGLDKLYLYRFRNGKLELINSFDTVPKSGPRHVAVAINHRKLYVVNEFNSKISVYHYNESITGLQLVQEISSLPADFEADNFGADIHIAHKKSYLYASNRGHHSIAIFKMDKDGTLSLVDYVSTVGDWPRSFALTPDENGMLIANEHSNSIVLMEIGTNGIPRYSGIEYCIDEPVCVKVK